MSNPSVFMLCARDACIYLYRDREREREKKYGERERAMHIDMDVDGKRFLYRTKTNDTLCWCSSLLCNITIFNGYTIELNGQFSTVNS